MINPVNRHLLPRRAELPGHDRRYEYCPARSRPRESAREFTERCTRFGRLGIDHAVVITSGPWTEETLATLASAAQELGQR